MTYFPSPVFRWHYTPSLFTALPLAPVMFLHVNVLLLYYPVAVLFVLSLAICSLCSVLPSAPIKFVARLCCLLLYSVIFCFACLASQTSGLCSAFPSTPVKSVTRFCYSGHLRHDYLIKYAYFDRMLFRTVC